MPIATVIALLNAAGALIPELAQAVPIVENMLNGATPSDADVATIESITAALNAQAAAAEQEVIAGQSA